MTFHEIIEVLLDSGKTPYYYYKLGLVDIENKLGNWKEIKRWDNFYAAYAIYHLIDHSIYLRIAHDHRNRLWYYEQIFPTTIQSITYVSLNEIPNRSTLGTTIIDNQIWNKFEDKLPPNESFIVIRKNNGEEIVGLWNALPDTSTAYGRLSCMIPDGSESPVIRSISKWKDDESTLVYWRLLYSYQKS
jgi:hypothetical protein